MRLFTGIAFLVLTTSLVFAQTKAPQKTLAKTTTKTQKTQAPTLDKAVVQQALDIQQYAIEQLKSGNDDLKKCLGDVLSAVELDHCEMQKLEARKQYYDFLSNPKNQAVIDALVKDVKTWVIERQTLLKAQFDAARAEEVSILLADKTTSTFTVGKLLDYLGEVDCKLAPLSPEERTKMISTLEISTLITNQGLKLSEGKAGVETLGKYLKEGKTSLQVVSSKTDFRVNVEHKQFAHSPTTLGVVKANKKYDDKVLMEYDLALADVFANPDEIAWKIIKQQGLAINGVPIDGDERWNYYLKSTPACTTRLKFDGHYGPYVKFESGVEQKIVAGKSAQSSSVAVQAVDRSAFVGNWAMVDSWNNTYTITLKDGKLQVYVPSWGAYKAYDYTPSVVSFDEETNTISFPWEDGKTMQLTYTSENELSYTYNHDKNGVRKIRRTEK